MRQIVPAGPGKPRHVTRRGFTLVEVLIVVVILGILASVLLPQFFGVTEEANASAIRQNLQQIRRQIELYKLQHGGNVPGPTAAEFTDQLLKASTPDGTTAPIGTDGYLLGPYVLGQFPQNPFNGLATVAVAPTNPKDDSTGWWYEPTSGEIRANVPDGVTDKSGIPVSSL